MCYLIAFHITLFVIAILCFVKGKLQISHRWVATGAPAYLAGVILLLPFPLTVVILALMGVIIGRNAAILGPMDGQRLEDTFGLPFFLGTIGVTTACLCIAFFIAMFGARDPEEVEREERRYTFGRGRDDDLGDEEDDYREPYRGRY